MSAWRDWTNGGLTDNQYRAICRREDYEESSECCGKCRNKIKDNGEWYCNCEDSEDYGSEIPYNHCCDCFE